MKFVKLVLLKTVLWKHISIKVKHHDGFEPKKCDICDVTIKSKQKLKDHIEAVHGEKKPFKCNICYISFSQSISLKRHIASIHEGVKPYKCGSCDKSYSYRIGLNKHIATALFMKYSDWLNNEIKWIQFYFGFIYKWEHIELVFILKPILNQHLNFSETY